MPLIAGLRILADPFPSLESYHFPAVPRLAFGRLKRVAGIGRDLKYLRVGS
jgi:hypothetical protein